MKKSIITLVALTLTGFAVWFFYPSFSYRGVYCNGELGYGRREFFVSIDEKYIFDCIFSGDYIVNALKRRLVIDVRESGIPGVEFIPVKLRWNAISTIVPLDGWVKIRKLKGNPDPWLTKPYTRKPEADELLTIFIRDSGDNTFPSPNDSRWVVTNKTDIEWFYSILSDAIDETLQNHRFGKSRSGLVLRFDFGEYGRNGSLLADMSLVDEGQPVYLEVVDYGYIAVHKRKELIDKLLEMGIQTSALSEN